MKKRIVASLEEDAMYDVGPVRPGTMADDHMEFDECGIVWISSVSDLCQRRTKDSVSDIKIVEVRTRPYS